MTAQDAQFQRVSNSGICAVADRAYSGDRSDLLRMKLPLKTGLRRDDKWD